MKKYKETIKDSFSGGSCETYCYITSSKLSAQERSVLTGQSRRRPQRSRGEDVANVFRWRFFF